MAESATSIAIAGRTQRMKVVRDHPAKSVLKAISWRIIGTLDTIVISYLLTGKMVIALSIGSVEIFTKMFLYFLHERAWEYFPQKKFRALSLLFRKRNIPPKNHT